MGRIEDLKEQIARLEESIAAFERMRDEMIVRRSEASESIAVILDQRLDVNAKTLDCLQRTLCVAKANLSRLTERAPPGVPSTDSH